jgi:hypothetical protein
MKPAVGTRHRIIEAHRYNPSSIAKATRKTRRHKSGVIDTFKKKGDVVIDSAGRAYYVERSGW